MDKSKFAVATYDKIAKIYTKEYFDDLTDTPYFEKFLQKLPGKAKILDVGCGPGQFLKYMNDKGFQVQGIDLSPQMIQQAQKLVPEGKFKLMDMRHLKFKDESFDGLLVAYSLIHIPSEEIDETLKGFKRVLKKKGHLQIIVQKGEPDKVVTEPMMKGEKIFVNFFTKPRLSKYLRKAGFKIEELEETKMQDPDSLSDRVIYVLAQKL